MKKYSMETIVGIFVVSEGFLPDFTGLMGKFSSDRTIQQYADEIWNAKPVKIEME